MIGLAGQILRAFNASLSTKLGQATYLRAGACLHTMCISLSIMHRLGSCIPLHLLGPERCVLVCSTCENSANMCLISTEQADGMQNAVNGAFSLQLLDSKSPKSAGSLNTAPQPAAACRDAQERVEHGMSHSWHLGPQ